MDGILRIMADKTVGFGWDSNYYDGILRIRTDKAVGFGLDFTDHSRQDSRFSMGFFYVLWHTMFWIGFYFS